MSDTTYYAAVAQELAEGKLDQALWLKAKAAHPTDDREAQALYVRLRVEEAKSTSRLQSFRNVAIAGKDIMRDFVQIVVVFAGLAVIIALLSIIFL